IFERLIASADYDAIFLGSGLALEELPYLLANLRADADQGKLPVLVFGSKDNKEMLAKTAERFRNVKVYSEVLLTTAEELKNSVEAQIKEAMGAKLTPAERKEFARVAIDLLWRMSRGELQGYDLRPAQEAILAALRNPDM